MVAANGPEWAKVEQIQVASVPSVASVRTARVFHRNCIYGVPPYASTIDLKDLHFHLPQQNLSWISTDHFHKRLPFKIQPDNSLLGSSLLAFILLLKEIFN